MELILFRVMRMRLKAAKRTESPTTLLENLRRIHQQCSGFTLGDALHFRGVQGIQLVFVLGLLRQNAVYSIQQVLGLVL